MNKFLEYRKLKRSGYTFQQLKEYFGDEIYNLGLYEKINITFPPVLRFCDFVNEIKINPEETYYDALPRESSYIKNKTDYIISFNSKNINYIICLMYFPINGIETYNIVFTTEQQWMEYNKQLQIFRKNGNGIITEEQFKILDEIISKETNFNDIYSIFKKFSWILLDFSNKHLKDKVLSIVDTENKKKINLYRNIIQNSFDNIEENLVVFQDVKYFLYKIL